MRTLLHGLKQIGLWIAALVILFEEWGWEPLARLLIKLGRLPVFARLEKKIKTLPPYAALALFFVPVGLLLPIKLLALYWLGEGHILLGLSVIVGAKIIGTAIVARLFMLTHDTLMRLPWFARGYGRWEAWKNKLISMVRATPTWQRLQARIQNVKRWWREGRH